MDEGYKPWWKGKRAPSGSRLMVLWLIQGYECELYDLRRLAWDEAESEVMREIRARPEVVAAVYGPWHTTPLDPGGQDEPE